MPGLSRVAIEQAGGLITGPGAPWCTVGGFAVSVVGDSVAPHGTGPHGKATLPTGVSWFLVGGKPVIHQGNAATCGHVATGCGWFLVTP